MMRLDPRGGWLLLAAALAGPGQTDATGSPPFSPVQQGEPPPLRDPFRTAEDGSTAPRPPGPAGVGVTEAVIRGIVMVRVPRGAEPRHDAPGWAIVESLTGEGFVAAPGDRFLDGVLGRIDAGGVVFWLEGDPDRPVHRPLALPKGPEEE